MLPADARVVAAQSFLQDVRAAEVFLHRRDGGSARARFEALLVQVREARVRLKSNPELGRPARFLGSRSVRGRTKAARAQALAASLGVPELRELVLRPYVMLYANGPERVVLLAIKHERQLEFQLP